MSTWGCRSLGICTKHVTMHDRDLQGAPYHGRQVCRRLTPTVTLRQLVEDLAAGQGLSAVTGVCVICPYHG